MTYNLLDEKWIPVLYHDGRWERVGIRKALTEAANIRQIAPTNPMDRIAILRLLLAVLRWCMPVATERELQQLGAQGAKGIPGDWLSMNLGTPEEPNSAFDLFDARHPFYQDAGLAVEGAGPSAVTNLLHDLPSGSKIAHFRHTRDGRDGMCPCCCALGLVRWPSVASAGTAGRGESMTASINGNTPAYSVRIGADLLATLVLAWPSSAVHGDAPVWDGANEASPLGFLKGMTWRSRRVLLAPPDAGGKRELSRGCCCYCGERSDRLVKWIIFRPGWKRPSKKPWREDPQLLRTPRKPARTAEGKEDATVPSWPSPNDPLEDHASVWRSVMKGLVARSVGSQSPESTTVSTLVASSQALYKHAGEYRAALPGLGPDVAGRLVLELEWLSQLTWITVAARGGSWGVVPKGHRIVEALCAPGAKGRAIRSALCALSPYVERELEKAFQKLMGSAGGTDHMDTESQMQLFEEWREKAAEILRAHVGWVVGGVIGGPPVRRQQLVQDAVRQVEEAIRQTKSQHGRARGEPGAGNAKAAEGGREHRRKAKTEHNPKKGGRG